MSRIDEALRASEKHRPPHGLSARFDLARFADEAPARATGQLRVEASVAGPDAPPVVTKPLEAAPSGLKALNSSVEARLVTAGAGAVSLEQYRRVAAVLHDIQLQQGLRTLMLTSALPAEGKTLTTVNLGLTLSESFARRVLVVDADLRWPSVHKMFGLVNGAGLSEALREPAGAPATVHQVSKSLSVVTAGNPGLTPLAGLTSPRMAELVELWSTQFDWVILDTPPVGLLPDAQPLARLTRAVVFVIAAGQTPSSAVERAIADLGTDCVIGTVLNRVENRQIPEAGYYARYGYGYYEDRERSS
jgi:capsular exopolysaccharide synthesis family protein